MQVLPQGELVEARYRAKNQNGWSSFSKSAFLHLVGPPARPDRLLYISSTGTTITLQIVPVS